MITPKRKKADSYLIEATERLRRGGGGWLVPIMKFLIMVAEELWGPSDEVAVVEEGEVGVRVEPNCDHVNFEFSEDK